MQATFPMILLLLATLQPIPGLAWVMGHHGGLITNCTDPQFMEESPPPDARVKSVENLSFTASPNTDPSTIEVRVNNTPGKVTVTRERSGYLTVETRLPAPHTQGRLWIKVTAISDDGCEQLHTWNVYAGQ